jgi:two-component system phosphate regulon response regulator PhoB
VATILIVDDEGPVREFLAELVQEAGHQALQAVHGREALEVVKAERPDLVLADVMLPILSGIELSRRLKADPDTGSIPVILMSSAVAQPSHQAGADDFIDKPVNLEGIEAMIRRWLTPG